MARKKNQKLSDAALLAIRKSMDEFDYKDCYKNISLKAARVNAGYSRNEVAQIMGVVPTTVSRWESGDGGPNMKTFLSLCRLYRMQPEKVRGTSYKSPYQEVRLCWSEEKKR